MKLSSILFLGLGCISMNVYAAIENQTTQTSSEQQMKMQSLPEKNRAESEAFLQANKNKPGVKTTDSGLQYKVITEGTGPLPTAEDIVTVHYSGKLIDGTEFDSSYKRGEPINFPLNGVIPGWTEALQQMKVGSTWELYIPSKLAYGEHGAPPVIGPNQALIFKVNLIGINGKKP